MALHHGKTASFAVIHLQSKQMRKVPYFACLENVMRGRAGQSVGLCFLRPLRTRSRKPCGVDILSFMSDRTGDVKLGLENSVQDG
jgi:hypothetical protein